MMSIFLATVSICSICIVIIMLLIYLNIKRYVKAELDTELTKRDWDEILNGR
jgi:hypothetical protein